MEKTKEFFQKYKNEVIFTLLIAYIFILGVGVAGEIFDIDWIVNLPLFRI